MNINSPNVKKQSNPQPSSSNATTIAQNYNVALANYTASLGVNKNAGASSTNKNTPDKNSTKLKLSIPSTGILTTEPLKLVEDVTVPSNTALAEKTKDDNLQRLTDTRNKVLQHYGGILDELKVNFQETLTQLFFIQSGGNMVDYPAWKMRPTSHLVSYLTSQRLDDSKLVFPTVSSNISTKNEPSRKSSISEKSIKQEPMEGNNVMEQYGFVQGSHFSNDTKDKSSKHSDSKISLHSSIHNKAAMNISSTNIQKAPTSTSAVSDIAGQVRHESETLHRISELRKNGLWSASRLPKVFEIPRKKSHSDFLLEEMQWLAADFSQERKWKRNMAKKISRSVLKYHQDKAIQEKRLKREETVRLRRIASGIAKEVKSFWQQIEKVASYKQQSRQEEQRRKALDLHLNFIVGQTEKYSSWLAEGMKESSVPSPASEYTEGDQEEEEEQSSGDSDEEAEDYEDELDALKKESEMPIEDLLETLPENMLKRITGEAHSDSETDVDDGESEDDNEEEGDDSDDETTENDEEDNEISQEDEQSEVGTLRKEVDLVEGDDGGEYIVENEKDDEETIAEEEKMQHDTDYKSELDDLQKEGELPLEELLKLYGQPSTPMDSGMDSDNEDDSEMDTSTEKKGKEASANQGKSVGVATTEELDNAAATAESLQPKGFTLSTTQVRTKIPHLLRGTLREYQHIGLDWLVTMYTKQLNGILADEMGLGKTIQTISLLAHLACEEGSWGPHLIVVPTSVMLNWEFEFKRWCPGFKILTYFGSQKERKLKRTGWSKPNAFHVCITSYKLVIQDHQAFRRKKWRYLILDEAQNIKNFKSQRWQMLLNFHSQRRLLLTGTPLQNNLMELWSLMHFLMPNIFQSHQDFKEWFSNPLTGMIEGSREYNEGIVKRLHSVLRPFLLRRLKNEVELQMPKKYEHVIKCRLSKRQRFLYDEFMSRTKTKETLEAGNFLSVINILMQLRKVCNHPDLFELRPTVSPFVMDALKYVIPAILTKVLDYNPFKQVDLSSINLCLSDLELNMTAFQGYRTQQLKVKKSLIQELESTVNDEQYVASSSSSFKPLSNISEGKLPIVTDFEEKRNLFDVLKDVENSSNTPQDSEASDVDNTDCEKSEDCNEGPPTKRQKLDNEEDDVEEIEEEQEVINDGKRLIDNFMMEDTTGFALKTMNEKAQSQQKGRFDLLATVNERHCAATPLYGSDLIEQMKITTSSRFTGALSHQILREKLCNCMSDMVKLPTSRIDERKEITSRFSIYIHNMVAYPIAMRTTKSISYSEHKVNQIAQCLSSNLKVKTEPYHHISMYTMLQFPETRLVQYDCGKLQALDRLLRQMKAGKHRGLIFTQMTKMLDVLERFLNYHGYIYLRLDGSTKVEQRQVLMERFNQDDKIFIFILSTRSGGIGVNLTGADTVIFYDSDWNPTMDAQAQDRCHRIGQTRDVHIYRLISDRTVEENILRKAQQKRMLCDLAIEGGNFTTAFFKQDSVKELFNMNAEEEKEVDVVVPTVKKTKEIPEEKGPAQEEKEESESKQQITNADYEKVLAETEEKDDVMAAEKAKIEQDTEYSEFVDNTGGEGSNENSKVEKALSMLEAELKPVERLALRFIESTNSYQVEDEVEETEKMLEEKKKEWELNHLQSLKEAEERKNAEEEDDMLFTYIRDETYDQHLIDERCGMIMPIWRPPTPPRDGECGVVVDYNTLFLYEMDTIPENHLPPTHYLKKSGMDLYAMKKNTNRTHYLSHFKKRRHRISKPKSIFDKKALELLNRSKLKKSQKLKQKAMTVPLVQSNVTSRPDFSQHGPEWLINEDWALLQAVQTLFELPLDFQNETVHNKLANWELAADIVNVTSKIRRSGRQCRDRYQNVLLPREEGKLMVPPSETNDVKSKKSKKLQQQQQQGQVPKPVSTHPQAKTSTQFNNDSGKSCLNMHNNKFDSVRKSAAKRKPVVKQTTSAKFQSGNRHAQILAANNIPQDKTLNPKELATMRAERIAKEKAQAVVAAQQLQQHQSNASSTTSSQTTATVNTKGVVSNSNAQVVSIARGTSTVNLVQQATTVQPLKGTNVTAAVGGNTLVVNPSGSQAGASTSIAGLSTTAASFAAINRKMQNVAHVTVSQVPATISGGRILGVQTGQNTAQIIPSLIQNKAGQTGTLTVAVSTGTSTNIVGGNLVPTIRQAASTGGNAKTSQNTYRLSAAGLNASQPLIQGKAFTQQQIAILRQKAAQQQQQLKVQQQRLQKHQQLKILQQQAAAQQVQQQQAAGLLQQQQTTQQTQQQQIQQGQLQTKQTQQGTVTSTNQLGSLTVQPMKAPVTLRGTVPQQIQPSTQQQLIQQALKKQPLHVLQRSASTSQIQQMLAGQKLTPQQLQQLQQQQQRHTQLQHQQQLKLQQQATASIVSQQPKAQLVMTQVKTGQAGNGQKTQQIQLQQLQQPGSVAGSIQQQILLRSSPSLTKTGQTHIQGIPQQIQLRAVISQQSNLPRASGATLQPMQAQVNLQAGTVVMQPSTSQTGSQVQVVSSLAQQQQRNIQAAVQKQIQQQHQQQQQQQQQNQAKVEVLGCIASPANLSKPTQVQVQLQQPSVHLTQQLQRQQVLSATPAQLSQVKAFVSQAQLQASLSRSNSPLGASLAAQQTVKSAIAAAAAQTSQYQVVTASGTPVSVQLQVSSTVQQIRTQVAQQQQQQQQSQAKSVETATNASALLLKQQQQLKLQAANKLVQQQAQQQLIAQQQQQQQQAQSTQVSISATTVTRANTFTVESNVDATQVADQVTDGNQMQVANQVELGAETELSTEEGVGEVDASSVPRMRTRTRSNKSS